MSLLGTLKIYNDRENYNKEKSTGHRGAAKTSLYYNWREVPTAQIAG
jgi:hypothetical protein